MYHESLYTRNDWTRVWTLDGESSNEIITYPRKIKEAKSKHSFKGDNLKYHISPYENKMAVP